LKINALSGVFYMISRFFMWSSSWNNVFLMLLQYLRNHKSS